MLYSFGREDQLDRQAIVRLIGSLQRALEPDRGAPGSGGPGTSVLAVAADGWGVGAGWLVARAAGRPHARRLLEGRRLDARAERVIFAMVANRALEPLSKLACSKWVSQRAWIQGLVELDEDSCYRSMDWLLEVEDELAEAVYFATADLLNLEVDLLFFDTTSTYFERDEAEQDLIDQQGNVIRPAFRTHGNSKDSWRRPAADCDRDGGHPHRDPDPGVVLAGEHQRSRADPPGQGRPARVEALKGGVGR